MPVPPSSRRTEPVDSNLLAAGGPRLKVIVNVAIGFDAATAARVSVTNIPGVLDRAIADHTLAVILAATRCISECIHAWFDCAEAGTCSWWMCFGVGSMR